jgi:hypothetical protein
MGVAVIVVVPVPVPAPVIVTVVMMVVPVTHARHLPSGWSGRQRLALIHPL